MPKVVKKETLNKYINMGQISDLEILKSYFSIDQACVDLCVELPINSQ